MRAQRHLNATFPWSGSRWCGATSCQRVDGGSAQRPRWGVVVESSVHWEQYPSLPVRIPLPTPQDQRTGEVPLSFCASSSSRIPLFSSSNLLLPFVICNRSPITPLSTISTSSPMRYFNTQLNAETYPTESGRKTLKPVSSRARSWSGPWIKVSGSDMSWSWPGPKANDLTSLSLSLSHDCHAVWLPLKHRSTIWITQSTQTLSN